MGQGGRGQGDKERGERVTLGKMQKVGGFCLRLLQVHSLAPKPSSSARFRKPLNLMEIYFILIYEIIQLIY